MPVACAAVSTLAITELQYQQNVDAATHSGGCVGYHALYSRSGLFCTLDCSICISRGTGVCITQRSIIPSLLTTSSELCSEWKHFSIISWLKESAY